jgi:hypothetical protein
MSGSKVELRCDMLEMVEDGAREVMPIDAAASGRTEMESGGVVVFGTVVA